MTGPAVSLRITVGDVQDWSPLPATLETAVPALELPPHIPVTGWAAWLSCNGCGAFEPLNSERRCRECHRTAVLRGAA